MVPSLSAIESGVAPGVCIWTDEELLEQLGVFVGFSERGGGVSEAPFDSLNLASHVGDSPDAVDENRRLFLRASGLEHLRGKLTMADQVHGSVIAVADELNAGSGAFAVGGAPPLGATDAIATATPDIPVALCFADCVPVVLVAAGPAVCVVHAGWRGALSSLAGTAAVELARMAGCDTARVLAYIGPHIRSCHYEVAHDVMSQFTNAFGTLARAASGGLDLDAAVTVSLDRAGVASCNIARLGACTAETTDRFFSYRAEGGRTGRHSALACIVARS